MTNKLGKLFKEVSTNKIYCFEYNAAQNYYGFIQQMLQQGYTQCIVTSDLMIKIIEYFILNGSIQITSIEFMNEDDELNQEISLMLNLMRENAAYWGVLKQKLSFLSENDSIEIKKVDFRNIEKNGSLFSVQVNGIIVISDFEFDRISGVISKIVEGCVR